MEQILDAQRTGSITIPPDNSIPENISASLRTLALTNPQTSRRLDSPPMISTLPSTSFTTSHRVSTNSFSIAFEDDERCWRSTAREGSTYSEVSHLVQVCWLDVRVQFDTNTLRPGIYLLSWRYQLHCLDKCWEDTPVTFKMSTTEGRDLLERPMYLCPKAASKYDNDTTFTRQATLCPRAEGIWIELSVFKFVVRKCENSQLIFSMSELGDHWKRGLVLDAVFITPCSQLTVKNDVLFGTSSRDGKNA